MIERSAGSNRRLTIGWTKKSRSAMPDETAAVLETMRTVGVHSFVLGKVKDEAEAVRMFREHFDQLVNLCQK